MGSLVRAAHHPESKKFFASVIQKKRSDYFVELPSVVAPEVMLFLPDAALLPVASMAPAEALVEPLVVTPFAPPDILPPIEPFIELPWALYEGEPTADELLVPLADEPPLAVCAKAAPETAIKAAREDEKMNFFMKTPM
jgi:hypothetical protein